MPTTFGTIAKYERKILMRSWFFRIFSVLSLFVIFVFNMGEISEVGDREWVYRAVPSNMPYASLYLLNLAQAIIAVFLSSEFIKRDRKQDTAEVFYVRSMSNATYLLGKAWSILSIFLIINVAALVMALIFNLLAPDTYVDWQAYLYYPALISLPTLLFVIGLASLLMGLIRNQALTFVILLGYILSSLIYMQGSYNYLFDFMAYYQPLFHSEIVGFGDWPSILRLRSMYACFGLGFLFLSIFLLKRLPQSKGINILFLILSVSLISSALWMGYRHWTIYQEDIELPQEMIALNNHYIKHARIDIEDHKISLEQGKESFRASSQISGFVEEAAKEFVFSLNPGLTITSVKMSNQTLDFERKLHLLFVQIDTVLPAGTPINLTVEYNGTIHENACFLDIDYKVKSQSGENDMLFNLGRKHVFIHPEYLLLTPETLWYPHPGVSYSDVDPSWYHKDFINYHLTVKTLPGLNPIAQGAAQKLEDNTYLFEPEHALSQLSLTIGRYNKSSFEIDSLTFSAYFIEGHDYFKTAFPDIRDTLPSIIREKLGDFERESGLKYPFKEFALVEVPGQFKSYDRTWTSIHENNQPGLVYIPEKGLYTRRFDFNGSVRRQKNWRQNRSSTPEQLQLNVLYSFLEDFFRFKNVNAFFRGGDTEVEESINPYYQFVQFYEMSNNLDSREWPVLNRIFESYLRADNSSSRTNWSRQSSGSTQDELANMVLQEKSFAEVLTLRENQQLIDNVIELKGKMLFSMIQAQAGGDKFRDFIIRLLIQKRFENYKFEDFKTDVQSEFDIDLSEFMTQWFKEVELPRYLISTPIAEKVLVDKREVTRIQFMASNLGEAAGVISTTIRSSAENIEKLLYLEAGQTKAVAYLSSAEPRGVLFNTLASGNLPNQIEYNFEQINTTTVLNAEEKEELIDLPTALNNEGEIIVDNEDAAFDFSHYEEPSRLRRWLRSSEEEGFKYKGSRVWRAPLNWTATTNDQFFGQFIRSSFYIKSGDGSKEVSWKVSVKEAGRYEVYYHVYKDESFNWNRNQKGSYQFKIPHGKGIDEPSIELSRQSPDGWVSLGDYVFPADTITISLSNESRLRAIFADAVKLVKMD